ncbi:MAG TPA: hypothetical protein VIN73_05330 [Vicingaceae bacterium]
MKKLLTILCVISAAYGCEDNSYYTTTDIELKLNIIPIETDRNEFDLSDTVHTMNIYLYIGKLKNGIINTEVNNEFGYYLQFNDVVRNTDDLKEWLTCYHCDESKNNILIIADKDVPEQLLTKIEYIIINSGNYFRNHIYYYEKNNKTRKSGYNHQKSRIAKTQTITYNRKKYIEFIKHFTEDSIKVKWIYNKPVKIESIIPYELLYSSSSNSLVPLPPPPPSINMFNFDTLNFKDPMFDSIKIVQTLLFEDEKKRNSDSLRNYYGRIIIFSLPYKSYNPEELFVDYEIVDWGWCGTGKYQTILYSE